MKNRALIAAALVILVAGLAMPQATATLGNMIQLGRATSANLPTPSTTIQGALIFDLDAGKPKYNNGTTWLELLDSTYDAGPGGSAVCDDYWYDAGIAFAGTAYQQQAIGSNYVIQNPDGGIGLVVGGRYTSAQVAAGLGEAIAIVNTLPGQALSAGVGFHQTDPRPAGITAMLFASSIDDGGVRQGLNIHSKSPVTTSIGATFGTAAVVIQTIGSTEITTYKPVIATTTNAATHLVGFQVATNGARVDFGEGSTDYFASDGGYIYTPNPLLSRVAAAQVALTFENTGALLDLGAGASDYLSSDGTGIASASYLKVAGFTDAGIPAAAAGNVGAVAYNTSIGTLTYSNGAAWVPVGTALPLTSVFVNAVTVAATTYASEPGPGDPFAVTAIRFTVSTPGTVGSTNANFRISSGASNCDCAFGCNSAAAGYRIACTGTCSFAGASAMTYAMTSIGDCTLGPLLQGNVTVEGRIQ